jgi:hypothetical protein
MNTKEIKEIKDMDLDSACLYMIDKWSVNHNECMTDKDEFMEFQSENARQKVINIFNNGGIDSPREIRIFCNIQFTYMQYTDRRSKRWEAGFIFEEHSLTKLYGTFMMPVGDPSLKQSWAFLASVYDENLEPYSSLCCNGFRTFKSER